MGRVKRRRKTGRAHARYVKAAREGDYPEHWPEEAKIRAARRDLGEPSYAPWSQELKEKVIAHALTFGSYRDIERKFGVPEGTVQRWINSLQDDAESARSLRSLAHAHTIERAWRSLDGVLIKLGKRVEEGLEVDDADLVQAVDRLARALNNLGAVEAKLRIETAPHDKRRQAAEELEQFEAGDERRPDEPGRTAPAILLSGPASQEVRRAGRPRGGDGDDDV